MSELVQIADHVYTEFLGIPSRNVQNINSNILADILCSLNKTSALKTNIFQTFPKVYLKIRKHSCPKLPLIHQSITMFIMQTISTIVIKDPLFVIYLNTVGQRDPRTIVCVLQMHIFMKLGLLYA